MGKKNVMHEVLAHLEIPCLPIPYPLCFTSSVLGAPRREKVGGIKRMVDTFSDGSYW